MAVSGAFGGLVFALAQLLEQGKASQQDIKEGKPPWPATKGVRLGWYILGRMLVGLPGSVAGVFGVLTIGKTVGQARLESYLYIVCLSVVSGFVGTRLLQAVGTDLAKKITNAEDKATNAEDKAKQATEKASALSQELNEKVQQLTRKADENKNKLMEYIGERDKLSLAINRARDIRDSAQQKKKSGNLLDETEKKRIRDSIRKLENFSDPTYRVLQVVRANLYDLMDDRDQARKVLQEFIQNKQGAGQGEDEHVAAAYYNIACYWSTDIQNAADAKPKTEYAQKAIDSLQRSMVIVRKVGEEYVNEQLDLLKHDLEDKGDLVPLQKLKQSEIAALQTG